MDQAAWHTSGKLKVADNITIVPLPPKSPELNLIENIWHLCEIIDYQTECSNHTSILSIITALHGTCCTTSHRK
ncbi:MAG: transposase [Methylocystaceae bacterium]|nr:transposase [Methylocystaceae bacterium]